MHMVLDVLYKSLQKRGEGLGLDSIDVLELIVLMDRHYGVRISDPQQGREVFQNVTTMAERILAEK